MLGLIEIISLNFSQCHIDSVRATYTLYNICIIQCITYIVEVLESLVNVVVVKVLKE